MPRASGKGVGKTKDHRFYEEIGRKGGAKVKELIEIGRIAMEERRLQRARGPKYDRDTEALHWLAGTHENGDQ